MCFIGKRDFPQFLSEVTTPTHYRHETNIVLLYSIWREDQAGSFLCQEMSWVLTKVRAQFICQALCSIRTPTKILAEYTITSGSKVM